MMKCAIYGSGETEPKPRPKWPDHIHWAQNYDARQIFVTATEGDSDVRLRLGYPNTRGEIEYGLSAREARGLASAISRAAKLVE